MGGFCDRLRPLVLFLAGLIGAAGVALAAAATHMGGALLGPASAMCLAHAPAMLALFAAHRHLRPATGAGLLMGLGTVLFAGDLVLKEFFWRGLLSDGRADRRHIDDARLAARRPRRLHAAAEGLKAPPASPASAHPSSPHRGKLRAAWDGYDRH